MYTLNRDTFIKEEKRTKGKAREAHRCMYIYINIYVYYMHIRTLARYIYLLFSSFFFFLLVTLQGLGSNTVQVSLTVLRDLSTTPWGDLNDTDLLKSLNDLSVDGPRSIDVLRRSDTSVLGVTVKLVQLTNTDLLSQVDVSGDRGSTLVEPALSILWRHLVTTGGLDDVDVTWNLQLTLSLQEGSVGVNEILGSDVSILKEIKKGKEKEEKEKIKEILLVKSEFA